MFNYLQKYNKLPKEVRDKLSAQPVMSVIESLEKEYGFSLAAEVMRVAIKEININNLEAYFEQNHALNKERSKKLSDELRGKVFAGIADYLGISVAEAKPQTAQIQPPVPQTMPVEKSDEVGIGDLVKNIPKTEEKAEVQPVAPALSSEERIDTGVKSGGKANFFFSSEDEKEIGDLVKKVGEHTDKPSGDKAEEKINKIISESQISFGSEELMQRLRIILKTYISGIRERVDTKQTLNKPVESGGLGLEGDAVDKIIEIADKYTKSLEEDIKIAPQKKIAVPEDEAIQNKIKDLGTRDVDYDLKALENKGKPADKLDTSHELAPPAPSVVAGPPLKPIKKEGLLTESSKEKKEQLAPPAPIKKEIVDSEKNKSFLRPNSFFKKDEGGKADEQKEEKKASVSKDPFFLIAKKEEKQKKEYAGAESSFPLRKSSQMGGKIRMDDVKFRPKTMGPIDELRYMDLINFRRLDNDPLIAANKIKEKIELMENYSERMEAVKAWRLSPVNKIYLKMGEASISNKKPIDAIIEERKSGGKEYLSDKEFEAVIRLNKSLRF